MTPRKWGCASSEFTFLFEDVRHHVEVNNGCMAQGCTWHGHFHSLR